MDYAGVLINAGLIFAGVYCFTKVLIWVAIKRGWIEVIDK